ncbi:hypothetical protein C7212DRAFT_361678 [Tuber magnatum]|uniref:Uncharacterized protein n=1 Tax=Tuber magnatum TaxID=42249 RepID=A0A317SW85_9PEZI|nr:hypothetical protein C7212DRAFT_361678 [Tuber magnatum]
MTSSVMPSSPPPRQEVQISSTAASDTRNSEDLIIYCCVCYLPVSSIGGDNAINPTRGKSDNYPAFWLASCGHIVCSSHVFPDGGMIPNSNCPYCKSDGISLAGVGAGEVPIDLRDYFRPESELLEDVAGAIKFRTNNLIRIAKHYKTLSETLKTKVEDQRRVLLKVKDELIRGKELKGRNAILERELANARQELAAFRARVPSAGSNDLPRAAQLNPSSPQTLSHESSSRIPAEDGRPEKRKASDQGDDDPNIRARHFRDELNKRQNMPPPMLLSFVQRREQEFEGGGGQVHTMDRRNEDLQGGQTSVGTRSIVGDAGDFQRPRFVPRREQGYQSLSYPGYPNTSGGQQAPLFRDGSQNEDQTLRPELISGGGFICPGEGQQTRDWGRSAMGYITSANRPFKPHFRQQEPPLINDSTRSQGKSYYGSLSNRRSPEASYGRSPPLQMRERDDLAMHMPIRGVNPSQNLPEQGGSPGYQYGQTRGAIPSSAISGVGGLGGANTGGSFNDPSSSRTLGNQIRRPASVADFTYRAPSHGGGPFSRRDESASLANKFGRSGTETPGWRSSTAIGSSYARDTSVGVQFGGNGNVGIGVVAGRIPARTGMGAQGGAGLFGAQHHQQQQHHQQRGRLGDPSGDSIGDRDGERPGLRRSVRRN